MPLVPHRFLLRVAHACRYRKGMPTPNASRLLDLGEEYCIENFAAMDGQTNFASVALAWNERGLGVQVEVRGKEQLPVGTVQRPRGSDGVTLWLDTRDARASHRAGRYCHQFHFLASGGGDTQDEPAVVQAKIARATEDAPLAALGRILLKVQHRKTGYCLEAFVPADSLHGFDPEEHPRLGFFLAVRDDELGDQLSNLDTEFPFWEDPSLWSVLELAR